MMSSNTKYLNNKKYTYEYFTQENVCRLCWKTTGDVKSIRNDAVLAQNIEEHISVNVTKHILQSVCCVCAEKVESFSQFYTFCHAADIKLERILSTGSNNDKKVFEDNYHDPIIVEKEADKELKLLKKVPKLKKEEMSYNLKDFQVNSDDEFFPNEDSFCYTCILNLESAEKKKKHDVKVHKLKQLNIEECCFCNKKFTKFSQKIGHEMQCDIISKAEKRVSVPKRMIVKVKKESRKKLNLHQSPMSSPLRSPVGSPPIPQKNDFFKPKPKVISCQLCPETFNTYREYNRHRFVHRRNVKCICEICGNKYPKDALARHMRIHTGHKVKCPHCSFSGHFSENVRAHIRRVHLRERRFACHICPLRCFTKHNLNVHIKTHFGVKDFKCELCPKRYSMKIALQQHIKLVHEGLVGQYKCTYCTSRYNKVESLRKHMLKGHGKRIRACKGSFYEVDDKNGENVETNQEDIIMGQSDNSGYVNNNA